MKHPFNYGLLIWLLLAVSDIYAQTPAKNKANVINAYQELNKKNSKAWGPLFYTWPTVPGGYIPYWFGPKNGNPAPESLRALELGFVEYFKSFPDAHWTVENATAEGNTVTVELLSSGTFKNRYMDWEATGRKFSFLSTLVFTLDNKGKIVTGFPVADMTPYLN